MARRGLHKSGSAQKTPPGRVAFLERATGKAAQRRLRRMQQAAFKAVPRLADTNVAARRLAQRGNHRSAACGR